MGPDTAGLPSGRLIRTKGCFPGLPEALALGCAFLLYLPHHFPPLLFYIIMICAGICIIILGSLVYRGLGAGARPRTRQSCLALCGIGMGVCLGALLSLRVSLEETQWCGFPPEKACGFEAGLICDSRASKSGAQLCEISIYRARGSGIETDAKLRRSILIKDHGPLYEGMRIALNSPIPPAQGLGFVSAQDTELRGYVHRGWELRARAKRGFIQTIFKIPSAGTPLLIALLSGDRAALSAEEEELYRRAGCLHILALSGQHIGILASLLGYLLIPLLGKRPALILSSVAVILYLLITGVQASILRAVLAYCLSCLIWFLGRKARGSSVIAWTFIIALCIQPASRFSPSFCLSYGASLGIILFAPSLTTFLSKWIPPFAAKAFAVSLGACAASAPISIALFGSFNPGCILTATLAGPLVSVFMWAGCAACIACALIPLPWLAYLSGAILNIPYLGLRRLMELGARIPGLSLAAQNQRVVACALLALILLLLYTWRLYGTPRLRFAQGSQEIHGRARLCHAKEVRPELPRLSLSPSEDCLPS